MNGAFALPLAVIANGPLAGPLALPVNAIVTLIDCATSGRWAASRSGVTGPLKATFDSATLSIRGPIRVPLSVPLAVVAPTGQTATPLRLPLTVMPISANADRLV